MTQVYLERDEALQRMERRSKQEVTWTLKDVTVRWRHIDGRHARNWDGSPSPNFGCTALERMVWRQDSGPRYTNYW